MKYVLLGAIFLASTVSAHATPVGVPEIDAFSGMSALGALAAIGALLWERGRAH